jgi:hypothetical protein
MNLHANAALSLNKRRDLWRRRGRDQGKQQRRVVDERWTLKRAAEAAEVSERSKPGLSRPFLDRTFANVATSL